MDIYKINDPAAYLSGNEYPGRGVLLGSSPDGKAVVLLLLGALKRDGRFSLPFRASLILLWPPICPVTGLHFD